MSYTYSTWLAAVANAIVEDPADADFVAILPSAIDYAEQRLYAELDLLNTVTRDTGLLVVGNRNFTLPSNLGRFVVTNGLNLITPATIVIPEDGTRVPLIATTREYLDMVGGGPVFTAPPVNYAVITDQDLIVGPARPDAGYTVEVIGTIRPTPLSPENDNTYLTNFLPQLWFAATMIFLTGWQQNFGSQADNAQMAQSWESQYKTLFDSINIEEQRKRYAAGAWASLSPTPIAATAR
jgi:hypothetical protein